MGFIYPAKFSAWSSAGAYAFGRGNHRCQGGRSVKRGAVTALAGRDRRFAWSPFRLPIDVRYRGQPDTGVSFLSLSQKSERCRFSTGEALDRPSADWFSRYTLWRRSTFLSAHTHHIQHTATPTNAYYPCPYRPERRIGHLQGTMTFLPAGDVSHRTFVTHGRADNLIKDIHLRIDESDLKTELLEKCN